MSCTGWVICLSKRSPSSSRCPTLVTASGRCRCTTRGPTRSANSGSNTEPNLVSTWILQYFRPRNNGWIILAAAIHGRSALQELHYGAIDRRILAGIVVKGFLQHPEDPVKRRYVAVVIAFRQHHHK